MMKQNSINFFSLEYLIKIGIYFITSFPIIYGVIEHLKNNNILDIKIDILILTLIISIILSIIFATIHNIYNYCKSARNINEKYYQQINEKNELEKKYNNLNILYQETTNKYNNLYKDYCNSLLLGDSILDIIKTNIMDKTEEETMFLKQLYSIIFIEQNNRKKTEE